MIAGVGLDMVDVAAFNRQLEDTASVFGAATFTRREFDDASSRPSGVPARHLAARFAAKEALLKAWSQASGAAPPDLVAVDLREIEVVTDAAGRPHLRLHGRVAEALAGLGLSRLHLSLTHDGGYAMAMVVIEGAGRT